MYDKDLSVLRTCVRQVLTGKKISVERNFYSDVSDFSIAKYRL